VYIKPAARAEEAHDEEVEEGVDADGLADFADLFGESSSEEEEEEG
jgi:hypothetical protein